MRCGAKRELSIVMRTGVGTWLTFRSVEGIAIYWENLLPDRRGDEKDFACGFACCRGWGKDWDEYLDERDAAW